MTAGGSDFTEEDDSRHRPIPSGIACWDQANGAGLSGDVLLNLGLWVEFTRLVQIENTIEMGSEMR